MIKTLSQDEAFRLEIRAIVRKYYPNNLGHRITVDLPEGTK